jgi:hypothetical protein
MISSIKKRKRHESPVGNETFPTGLIKETPRQMTGLTRFVTIHAVLASHRLKDSGLQRALAQGLQCQWD